MFLKGHTLQNLRNQLNSSDRTMEGDALDHLKAKRPDSKWVVQQRVTKTTFYVNHIVDHPIGEAIDPTAYLKNNKGLMSLTNNPHKGQFDKDNLFFSDRLLFK